MSSAHPYRAPRWRRRIAGAAACAGAVLVAACHDGTTAMQRTIGDPAAGDRLLEAEACGSCHVIPGHASGTGHVGPPLGHFARRSMIAGLLPNTPDNLVRWLQSPQSVAPGNVMPDMQLSRRGAADIAAYLYTLK